MITREQLVEMFDNMARETSWDLRKPLVWGYFFTHGSRPALEAVVPLLQALFLLFSGAVIFANLVADLLYGWFDPRVRT